MKEDKKNFTGLSANQIKYILIIAMVIDHIAWGFVEKGSAAWEIMHFFGRLTGPGMAFFLVQGYIHTRDFKKYAQRLFAFAVLSWPAFVYFENGHILPVLITDTMPATNLHVFAMAPGTSGRVLVIYTYFGVIYTLFLSLMALRIYDEKRISEPVRICGIMGVFLLSVFGDWAEFDILFALIFYRFRNEKKKMWALFCIMAALTLDRLILKGTYGLYQLGIYLVPILFSFYNGKRGDHPVFNKWFFYIFYPAHLWLLGFLRW